MKGIKKKLKRVLKPKAGKVSHKKLHKALGQQGIDVKEEDPEAPQ